MIITFYNSETGDHFQLRPSFSGIGSCWIGRGNGEGGEFDSQQIDNVIYDALNKFFEENF